LKNILVDDSELRRSAKKVQSDNTASFPAMSMSEPMQTNNSRRLLFESAILAPKSLGYLDASLTQ